MGYMSQVLTYVIHLFYAILLHAARPLSLVQEKALKCATSSQLKVYLGPL